MPIYNEFRSKTYDDVVGQESTVAILKSQVMHGNIPNALLFSGTRGTGKTTIARITVKAINCEHPVNGNPCLQCSSCKIIESGCPDIVEIDGASNNSVDAMREVIKNVQTIPTTAKYRAIIIDEAHMLSSSAFNALLKTLEEPPARTIFILCTTERHKILPTIASRCQRMEFRSLSVREIEDRIQMILSVKNYEMESDAIRLVAIGAQGSMRDGLSDLDKLISVNAHTMEDVQRINGILPETCYFGLLNAYSQKNLAQVLRSFNELELEQVNMSITISTLLMILSDKMVYLTSGELLEGMDKTDFYKNEIRKLPVSYNDCLSLMEALSDSKVEIKYAFVAAIAKKHILEEQDRRIKEATEKAERALAALTNLKNLEPTSSDPETTDTEEPEEKGTEEPVQGEDETKENDSPELPKTTSNEAESDGFYQDDECPFDDEPEDVDSYEEPEDNCQDFFEGFDTGFPC